MNKRHSIIWLAALILLALAALENGTRADVVPPGDVVFADFEGQTYGLWRTEGTAFGTGPATGTLPQQMEVTGFEGKRLVNSFVGGDDAQGRLISPDFTIRKKFIAFLIGGGGYIGKTCVNLVADNKIVRTAVGPNTSPGGRESLKRSGWDVQDLSGKTAHLEIVDAATGGWGHITMDQIVFTDTKPPLAASLNLGVSRMIVAKKPYLNIPIKNDAPLRTVTVSGEGTVIHRFTAALADETPDWWAFVEVGDQRGKALTISVDALPENSRALDSMTNADKITGAETLYREPLRPQFHFSAKRGWLNDPNGLVYYKGEYHLFFQHCPFHWGDGPKYWGHAISPDLVHWKEVEEALSPDGQGAIWSGSAVADRKNSSGFGKNGESPLVLIYTAAGDPFDQRLAYSVEGRHFTKFAGNPVVGNITAGNRDPRVFWHEPTQRWVQALYVEEDKKHTVHFLTSPNLRDWTPVSVSSGQSGTNFIYECPDIFPLALDGDTKKTKWILTGADSQYQVGGFDGATFTPETPVLPGNRGRGFYAAQTFNDEPKNRRIQIGWWQTETRAMPFNQSMSLPLELKLISTPDGPRMTWSPVNELESLRGKAHHLGALTMQAGKDSNPLSAIHSELVEIQAVFTPEDADEVTFTVRGIPVVLDMRKGEISVNGHSAPAPLRHGKQRVTIYADRTGLEVFASDSLTFVPMPVNLKPEDTRLSVSARGGSVTFDRLDVYELQSAWR